MKLRWKHDNRRKVSAAVHGAAAAALSDAAEFLLEEANRTAPIEEGTLIGSGATDVDAASLRASVSYDTPYAARQHEDLTLRHNSGRRSKWLERTMKEQAKPVGELIGRRMRGDLS